MSSDGTITNIPSDKTADYQVVGSIVKHAKFGKMWELVSSGGIFSDGHQYALRNQGQFFAAESYATNTKVYYNPATNSFEIESIASEQGPMLVAIRAYDVSVGKYWNIVDESMRKLLAGYQFIIKMGKDSYDAMHYKDGKKLVVHKLTGSACVVDESFKISLKLDEPSTLSKYAVGGGRLAASLEEEDMAKVMVCHVDGTNSAEVQNPEEINVVIKLVKQLLIEGTQPSEIGITTPFKAQLLSLQKRLSKVMPPENVFYSGDNSSQSFKFIIISTAIMQGKAMQLGSLTNQLPKLFKRASESIFFVCDANYLFASNKQFEQLLTYAEENELFLDPNELQ